MKSFYQWLENSEIEPHEVDTLRSGIASLLKGYQKAPPSHLWMVLQLTLSNISDMLKKSEITRNNLQLAAGRLERDHLQEFSQRLYDISQISNKAEQRDELVNFYLDLQKERDNIGKALGYL